MDANESVYRCFFVTVAAMLTWSSQRGRRDA